MGKLGILSESTPLRMWVRSRGAVAAVVCLAAVGTVTSGCRTSSSMLAQSQHRPESGVAEVEKTRWTDVLRPRPKLDKVDLPAWEVPDKTPDVGKVQLAYGRWMQQSGNAPAAEEAFKNVLASRPDDTEALIGLAAIESVTDRNSVAKDRLLRVVALEPTNVEALTALGRIELDAGKLAEAADYFSRAVQADPNATAARYSLAMTRARQGRLGEARVLFIATVGEAEAHHNIGMILKETHPYDAIAEFRQAIEKKPTLAASSTELASLIEQVGGNPGAGRQIQPASHTSGQN